MAMTRETVPAMLLHIDAEIAHRQASVREDWARSRRAPRTGGHTDTDMDTVARAPVLRGLRRSAHRLLHT
jgi:hypothetical protein